MMNEMKFIDKTYWPEGPWINEPDKVTWIDEETGLDCIARRNTMLGVWCGYVAVTKGHPLYGTGYDDADGKISIHGGLTYSAFCNEDDKETGICHIKEENDKAWWFGFDCGHNDDYNPGDMGWGKMIEENPKMESFRKPDLNLFVSKDNYKDLKYVMNQCHELAVQLKNYREERE